MCFSGTDLYLMLLFLLFTVLEMFGAVNGASEYGVHQTASPQCSPQCLSEALPTGWTNQQGYVFTGPHQWQMLV